MTSFQHLFECFLHEWKWRVAYFGFAFVLCLFYCYNAFDFFLFLLSWPLTHLYPWKEKDFIFTDMGEAFTTSFLAAIYFTCVFCFPLFLYLGLCFFRPSLYSKEASSFSFRSFLLLVLFVGSFTLCYFLVLPVFWTFFISFDASRAADVSSLSQLRLEARISTYVLLTLQILMCHHLLFFIPFVLFLSTDILPLSTKTIGASRRRWVFVNLFFAALISPPDFFLQAFFFSIFCFCTEVFFIFFLLHAGFGNTQTCGEKE